MRIPIVGTIQTKITDNRNRDMNPVPYFGYLENMFRFDVFKDRLIKPNRLIDNSRIIRDPISIIPIAINGIIFRKTESIPIAISRVSKKTSSPTLTLSNITYIIVEIVTIKKKANTAILWICLLPILNVL